MRLISFDGLTLGQAMAEDENPLGFVTSTQELPGMAGAYDNFGDDQIRTPLTIKKTLTLVATTGSDIGDLLDAIRAKANLGRRWLIVEMTDGSQRGTWAKLLSVDIKHGIENLVYVPVTLTFLATWPWWEDEDQIWRFDTGELFDDGLNFDQNFTTRSGAGTMTITNNGGDVISKGMILVVGPSTAPIITNGANGYSISYGASVAAGSTLFIDFGEQTVIEAGVSGWNNVTLGDDQVGFFKLETGANLITFTGGGILEIHWVEVY